MDTRTRIVDAAATLFYVNGVGSTTLDAVRTASGASGAQLDQHFPDKTALIHAVIDVQSRAVLAREEGRLAEVRTLAGLRRWRDALIESNTRQDGSYGCALGAMSTELSDKDERSRTALAQAFGDWQQLLVDTLVRLRDLGILAAEVDPLKLGTGLLAALQGGYVLAQNARNSRPMADALDMALDRIGSFSERRPTATGGVARAGETTSRGL
ncbi:TetR family transcriptional regulator C-terminal domain-containing protein [Kribbella sp. NPDC051770]|uniref:TetR/AcrR family transcriptional regulator n=1 Tax=Kribbella sp. NPDC051770 TaxID=3155413 RepID=UPI00341CFB3D